MCFPGRAIFTILEYLPTCSGRVYSCCLSARVSLIAVDFAWYGDFSGGDSILIAFRVSAFACRFTAMSKCVGI
jgi:hypothetical protein